MTVKFEEGDRVIYTGKYRDSRRNPQWGGKYGDTTGTVVRSESHVVAVDWSTGKGSAYYHDDIAGLKHAPKEAESSDEAKFKEGDRVIYTSGRFNDSKDHPLWGGKSGEVIGTVSKVWDNCVVVVKWDNGENESYKAEDLEHYPAEFKEGDRVIYTSGTWSDEKSNPLWNGKHGRVVGTITNMSIDGSVVVKWDNGESNCYEVEDLEHSPAEFKVGDRVIYTDGHWSDEKSNPIIGTITKIEPNSAMTVDWDNGTTNRYGSHNLEHAPTDSADADKSDTIFKEGDRVIYTSKRYGDSEGNPLWGGEYGKIIGTVNRIEGSKKLLVVVDWDNGRVDEYYNAEDLEYAPIETADTDQSVAEFKKGDRVIYTSGRYKDNSDNPRWKGCNGHIVGTVTTIVPEHTYPVKVEWDNGHKSCYRFDDLEFVKFKEGDRVIRTSSNYIVGTVNRIEKDLSFPVVVVWDDGQENKHDFEDLALHDQPKPTPEDLERAPTVAEFKEGDRVMYVSDKFGDSEGNPLWGGKHGKIIGTVIKTMSGGSVCPILVEWANGKSNRYYVEDLEFAPTFKEGDRVMYVSDKFGDSENNPLWGGKHGKVIGTVIKTAITGLVVCVKWDNGESNRYDVEDLEFAPTFKEGDRVIYTSGKYSDSCWNPQWGGKHGNIIGTITNMSPGNPIIVKWDAGASNNYGPQDLEHAPEGVESSPEIELKDGDRVIYTSCRLGDGAGNPFWGGKHGKIVGTVIDVTKESDHTTKVPEEFNRTVVAVDWDNGHRNIYLYSDLELVDTYLYNDLELAPEEQTVTAKFKNTDRVIYTSGRLGDCKAHPLWEGKSGKVIGTAFDFQGEPNKVKVFWDNGLVAVYESEDLENAPVKSADADKSDTIFKEGDRVIYISGRYVDNAENPLWGGKHGKIIGTVTKTVSDGPACPMLVEWANGKSNYYDVEDLEFAPTEVKPKESDQQMKTKFEEGDRVIYTGSYRDSSWNPQWGGKYGNTTGTVIRGEPYAVTVVWNTGKSCVYYDEGIKGLNHATAGSEEQKQPVADFKEGDRVIYTSGNHSDYRWNPLWGGKSGKVIGTVSKVWDDCIMVVDWDNGEGASYKAGDLECAPAGLSRTMHSIREKITRTACVSKEKVCEGSAELLTMWQELAMYKKYIIFLIMAISIDIIFLKGKMSKNIKALAEKLVEKVVEVAERITEKITNRLL